MRLLVAAFALASAAGCASTAPSPAQTPANADALAAYLIHRGLDVSPTVTEGAAVDGARLTTYTLGGATYVSARPRRTGDRDFDARAPWPLGVRSGDAYAYTHTWARGAAPARLQVYTFDGPADAERVRDALGLSPSSGAVYAAGSLVVVPSEGSRRLARALEAAFGPSRPL